MERGHRTLLLFFLPVISLFGLNACPISCFEDSFCGDGIAEGSEACDGEDLRGRTCADLTGRPFGSLACTAGCSFDRSGCSFCGDWVAEGSEQCDLGDLRGYTCDYFLPGSQGMLTCTRECIVDASACTICGDSILQNDEPCDCGVDASNLPTGCTDVNGGDDANCSADCQKLPYCGDGLQDIDEACDCGADASNLPTGCDDVNGGPHAYCNEACEIAVECNVDSYWETCDQLVPYDCCVDDWGIQPSCITLPGTDNPSYCMRECDDTMDCFWSNFCYAAAGNLCWPEVCGTSDWPNTEVNAFCTVTGVTGTSGEGYCWPILSREETTDVSVGICMEAGTLAHGATCDAVPIYSADRSEVVCDMGFCIAAQGSPTGTCLQFCDWEKAYAVAFYGAATNTEILPCPIGANCFAEATIDETTGIRSGDRAYCSDTEATDPTWGMTTCSLVNGHLLSNPSQTCTDAGFTNGRCMVMQFSSGPSTYGTIVGVCMDGAAAPNRAVWDLCDPDSPGDVCPGGSLCEKPDVFGSTPALAERCVPMCDTAHPLGAQAHCANLGAIPTADGTPFCQSMSLLFPPGGPLDIRPTRLGICGL